MRSTRFLTCLSGVREGSTDVVPQQPLRIRAEYRQTLGCCDGVATASSRPQSLLHRYVVVLAGFGCACDIGKTTAVGMDKPSMPTCATPGAGAGPPHSG